MERTAYLYVFDTMADWEVGYVVAELNSGRYCRKGADRYAVKTIGLTGGPAVTMGGVRVMPDRVLGECAMDDAALLLLPGGNTWLEDMHAAILQKAGECLRRGTVVAAICGATMGLAGAGLLNVRYHTSNDLKYLKAVCPAYAAEAFYRQDPAVADKNLVTASGTAPLEFAYQLFKALDIFSLQTLDAWYKLQLTHEPACFHELMRSLEA
jgi:putative intracellular protease/amidase